MQRFVEIRYGVRKHSEAAVAVFWHSWRCIGATCDPVPTLIVVFLFGVRAREARVCSCVWIR